MIQMHTTPRMRFGWLAEQRLPWAQLIECVELVEQLGYDGVWLSEHLSDEDGRWFLDAWTTLGAILGRIPRIEAGTLVASNSFRAPLLTAHMARTLADIAPGRFVLGLGAGGSRDEHQRVGVTFEGLDRRVAELAHACQVVRRATASDSPWQSTDSGRPAIPLLLGGGGSSILRLAGQAADRWAIWGTAAELASKGSLVAEFARNAGRQPDEVRRGAIVMVLPEHLPARPVQTPWPAALRGDQAAVTRQLADYAMAGVQDIIVCDYAVESSFRPAALEWFASLMVRFHGR
jgi:alkanesulfonate monooxygenase SsuD/methylene tetrahydromethanopterin reductase-like flavin-dependent oxidoreductase (luciferase family)